VKTGGKEGVSTTHEHDFKDYLFATFAGMCMIFLNSAHKVPEGGVLCLPVPM
jgi:hypothetical protein